MKSDYGFLGGGAFFTEAAEFNKSVLNIWKCIANSIKELSTGYTGVVMLNMQALLVGTSDGRLYRKKKS